MNILPPKSLFTYDIITHLKNKAKQVSAFLKRMFLQYHRLAVILLQWHTRDIKSSFRENRQNFNRIIAQNIYKQLHLWPVTNSFTHFRSTLNLHNITHVSVYSYLNDTFKYTTYFTPKSKLEIIFASKKVLRKMILLYGNSHHDNIWTWLSISSKSISFTINNTICTHLNNIF